MQLGVKRNTGVFDDDCVRELHVELRLKWGTLVDVWAAHWSLMFPQCLFGLPVVYELSVANNSCCNLLNGVT